MQKSISTHSPFTSLPNLDELAARTGFIIRQSDQLTASTFLQSLAAAVVSGQASYNQIAMGLSTRTGLSITSQGVHQRFSEDSTAFLTAVLHQLLAERFTSFDAPAKLKTIRRILVEDSSVQSMPKANAGTFPAMATATAAPPG